MTHVNSSNHDHDVYNEYNKFQVLQQGLEKSSFDGSVKCL